MSNELTTVLITGTTGMIGSILAQTLLDKGYNVIGVDRRESKITNQNYKHFILDISDRNAVDAIFRDYNFDRIIHLAALAHTTAEKDLSWDKYYRLNVECAKNIFRAAGERPVLFISTVDVYGFAKGIVNVNTAIHPVTSYGKSKAMAEEECKKLKHYTILRLSPVYTPEIKRDIQKRYYIKYPKWAYLIGKGSEYEILSIDNAVQAMADWCENKVINEIRIIKDQKRMNTSDYIKAEKAAGRANCTIHFPRWLVTAGYCIAMISGKNKYTYLLNKAVYPLRTE